jgi:hypothetical protein
MDKEQLKLQLFAAPSFLILGLGINGVFSDKEYIAHPFLENSIVGYSLLVIGGILSAISLYKAYIIFKRR